MSDVSDQISDISDQIHWYRSDIWSDINRYQ